MSLDASAFPAFPPGLWRRIELDPHPGVIAAALEDDVHRFALRLEHDGARIVAVHAETIRAPWTECPGAAAHLAGELAGELLADVARRDPYQHCTHLLDVAILCAAHAGDAEPLRIDLRVADRVDGRTTATLAEDGIERMRWLLDDTRIAGPGDWTGRDLRRLSAWKGELSARDAERATLLRRAVFVSGARAFTPPPGNPTAAEQGEMRQGVCFNYQQPQASRSTRLADWRQDFSLSGGEPLADARKPAAQ